MARVCINDFFVPDDRLTEVLDLLSDASAASDGNGPLDLDLQFGPVDFAPPRDPVEQAVGEAVFIANQSGPQPPSKSDQVAALVGSFVEQLVLILK